MPAIVKIHTIEPPFTDRTLEDIDANFDLLFRLLAEEGFAIVPVSRGGTGQTHFKRGDILYAKAPLEIRGLEAEPIGLVLRTLGVLTPPEYGKVILDPGGHVEGTLPIGNGGTGQTTKDEAFDALSPTTTFGDLIVMGTSDNERLPLGSKDQFLVVDPSASLGVAWKTVHVSALIDYFLLDTASDIGGYKAASTTHSVGAQVDTNYAGLGDGDTLLEEWATPTGEPALDFLPDGLYHLHVHATKTAGTKTAVIFFRVYKRTAGGVETLIVTSEESQVLTALEQEIDLEAAAAEIDVDTTDRVVVKLYATVTGVGSAPTVQIEIEGATFSRLEFPIPGIAGTAAPGGGAPTNAEYIVGALHADLSAERVLQGTANRVSVDLATPGLATLSAPQDLHTAATPQFARLGLGAAADAAAAAKFVGQYFSPPIVHSTPGAAETIDWNQGNEHTLLLDTDDCALTFSNPIEGGRYIVELVQDGTGGRDVTWPAGILWPRFGPPTLSTVANRIDLVTLYYRDSTYRATYSMGHRTSGFDAIPYLVDADTLDGYDSTAFAKLASSNVFTGATQTVYKSSGVETTVKVYNTAGGIYFGVTNAGVPFAALLDGSGAFRANFWTGSASTDDFSVPGLFSIGGPVYVTNKITPATLGATENDYAPANFAGAFALRLTPAAGGSTITGIAGGSAGRMILVSNIHGSETLTLANESASSTANNRIIPGVTLAAYESCLLWYDNTFPRWRAITGT